MSEPRKTPEWQNGASDNTTSLPPPTADKPESEVEQLAQAPTTTEDDVSNIESESPNQDIVDKQRDRNQDLLEQARRFLEDPAIRDASTERKIAFLESKGVSPEDSEAILGVVAHQDESRTLEDVGSRAWSTNLHKSTEVYQTPPPEPRVLPPIVTYPEFLAINEKPPPLMTKERLVATAYVTGGLMASIYGLSKFIIAPMAQNLAESRHEFSQHTQEQLKQLNGRLVKAVSIDPTSKAKTAKDIADDVSEADSDPTELYHRDCGTQTTPTLSRRPSVSSTDLQPLVTAHENRLNSIKSHLEELQSNRAGSNKSQHSLRTKITELSTYLSNMSYQSQYYSNTGFYGAPSYGVSGATGGKNDQIEAVKGDIRAVKGVFLSAKNFPTGGNNMQIPTGNV